MWISSSLYRKNVVVEVAEGRCGHIFGLFGVCFLNKIHQHYKGSEFCVWTFRLGFAKREMRDF